MIIYFCFLLFIFYFGNDVIETGNIIFISLYYFFAGQFDVLFRFRIHPFISKKWRVYKTEKATQKQKEKSIKKYKIDVRCSKCDMWLSENFHLVKDFEKPIPFESVEFGFIYSCPKCGHCNYFNCDIAPVAIACDENGKPLEVNN